MNRSPAWTHFSAGILGVLGISLLCGAKAQGCGGDDPIPIGSDTGGGTSTAGSGASGTGGAASGSGGSSSQGGTGGGGTCCPASYTLYSCTFPDGTSGLACHNPALGCASSQTCGQGCDPVVTGQCADGGTGGSTWYQGCGAPACQVGYDDPNIANCSSSEMIGNACVSSGQECEIPNPTGCSTILVCASTPPDTSMCPISRAKYKNGIRYVDDAELTRVRDELLKTKLARWHYNGEAAGDREHFGFIIDDDPSSPAVAASGERVDLYGYASMATAAIQVQAKQIDGLEREVEALRKELAQVKRSRR